MFSNNTVQIDGNVFAIGEAQGQLYLSPRAYVGDVLFAYKTEDCTGATFIISLSDSDRDSLEPQSQLSSVSEYHDSSYQSKTGKTSRTASSALDNISSFQLGEECLQFSLASIVQRWNDYTNKLGQFAETQYAEWLGNPPDALVEDPNPELTNYARVFPCQVYVTVSNHGQYFAALGGQVPNCDSMTLNEQRVMQSLYSASFQNLYGSNWQLQDLESQSISIDSLGIFNFTPVEIPSIDGWEYVVK